MVKVLTGSLFESSAQTIVNTVNCVGVMGKGIALEFKNRFPDMFADYVARCEVKQVKLGVPYLYRRLLTPWIINFPTKDHWRSVATVKDIVRGMEYLEAHYKEWEITSLALPPLGCGQGQLEWRIVGPTLYRYLNRFDIPIELYAPYGTPPKEMDQDFLIHPPELAVVNPSHGRIDFGWVALIEILSRIEDEPYHWPVGRTTFQKIAYFATEKGIPTDLKYSRSSFGPFAPDLKRKVTQLVNNGLIQEEQLGRMFNIKVGPTFKDARRNYQHDIKRFEPTIEQIVDVFLRMSTKQAEIAATVHYAAETLSKEKRQIPAEMEVLEYIMEWKQKHRPPIDKFEVSNTIRNLAALQIIKVRSSDDLPLPDEVLV